MFPAVLLTVIMPSATFQFAGFVESFADSHWSRFFPSNKIIASEGASLFVFPGVTTGGTGLYTSVSLGSPCCAFTNSVLIAPMPKIKRKSFGLQTIFNMVEKIKDDKNGASS